MPTAFNNHLPVNIHFGDGRSAELPQILDELGSRRPALILDPSLGGIPAVEQLIDMLETSIAETFVLTTEPGEPTLPGLEALFAGVQDGDADALVAIGGGSVMDTAKAARLLIEEGVSPQQFGTLVPQRHPQRPLITVPTTAGTGSEVSGGSVVIDPEERKKLAVAGPLMRAQHAVVDPVLTHGLPPAPTLYGGVDALAQALAAVVVTCATPVGDGVALEAVRLATQALPEVVADGSDAGGRNRMACASLMAGLAMNISECGSEHSLAHPLGVRHQLPHGLSVGLVLAETMDHDRGAVPERFERIADAMGAPPSAEGDGRRAVAAVEELLARVEFPVLGDFVEGVAFDELAAEALAGWIPVAPREWTSQDIEHAYRSAYSRPSRA